MCHRLALSRNASAFTVVGQDERGHGIGGRGRILKAISRRVVPGGTGTIGAAAWAIETVVCGAFAVRRWVEPAVAEAGRMGPWYSELVRATVRDHV